MAQMVTNPQNVQVLDKLRFILMFFNNLSDETRIGGTAWAQLKKVVMVEADEDGNYEYEQQS